MAFTLRSLFLLCGISALLTGVVAGRKHYSKDMSCDSSCPEGWTQLGSRCFIYQDVSLPFVDADNVCRILGGNLASVHSTLEYAVVLELAKAATQSNRDIWLGLHEGIEYFTFLWTDGSRVDFNLIVDTDTNAACIMVNFSDTRWYREGCNVRNRFVCARDAQEILNQQSVSKVEFCCPKGWTQLNGRCFIYEDKRMSFADAEHICKILGGNLASVHSALEYSLVLALIQENSDSHDDVWLGLNEAIEKKKPTWTDGSIVDFTAFNRDNDYGDCFEIEFSDLLWDNDDCGDVNRFVCGRDAECRY
ncbi:macrophage mannose receptor 1-like [Stigmatopora nigra]